MTVRDVAKKVIPGQARRTLRVARQEIPIRVRDLFAATGNDAGQLALPPASLRLRVGRTSAKKEFLEVGLKVAESLLGAVRAAGSEPNEERVLDFGCGSGRVARHMIGLLPNAVVSGIDVDAEAINWCSKHLRGRFLGISPLPPTPLPGAAFDLIYAVSVFTHLDEFTQDRWLSEVQRLLKPGGLFLASTHNPVLTFERPDLSEAQHRALQGAGLLFAPGHGSLNEDSTFHSPEYLRAHWSSWFETVAYAQHGLAGYQDLSVWRRRA